MKAIGVFIDKIARHRRFHWCRRPNGFSDMPVWRVIAATLSLPLHQVLAFVNRLEELANASETRGHVGHFSAAEFGAALGMPAADAARIFAALEDPEIAWVSSDHVADFHDRNPDREDATVNDRKRRSRARSAVCKQLAQLVRIGGIAEEKRRSIELTLKNLPDHALFALLAELQQLQQSTLSTGLGLSTGHGGHDVTKRDIVTVTPEQSTKVSSQPVDNSGLNATSTALGQQDQGVATVWLLSTGLRIITERMQVTQSLAETRIERWRRDLQNDAALQIIIEGADKADYAGARFHNLVVDGIKRAVATQQLGERLPLPPMLATQQKRLA